VDLVDPLPLVLESDSAIAANETSSTTSSSTTTSNESKSSQHQQQKHVPMTSSMNTARFRSFADLLRFLELTLNRCDRIRSKTSSTAASLAMFQTACLLEHVFSQRVPLPPPPSIGNLSVTSSSGSNAMLLTQPSVIGATDKNESLQQQQTTIPQRPTMPTSSQNLPNPKVASEDEVARRSLWSSPITLACQRRCLKILYSLSQHHLASTFSLPHNKYMYARIGVTHAAILGTFIIIIFYHFFFLLFSMSMPVLFLFVLFLLFECHLRCLHDQLVSMPSSAWNRMTAFLLSRARYLGRPNTKSFSLGPRLSKTYVFFLLLFCIFYFCLQIILFPRFL
jgi:hypothetical protein